MTLLYSPLATEFAVVVTYNPPLWTRTAVTWIALTACVPSCSGPQMPGQARLHASMTRRPVAIAVDIHRDRKPAVGLRNQQLLSRRHEATEGLLVSQQLLSAAA